MQSNKTENSNTHSPVFFQLSSCCTLRFNVAAATVLPVSSAVVSLDSASSPVASSSLTKLEGNSPDLLLKLPLHQPSSTCADKIVPVKNVVLFMCFLILYKKCDYSKVPLWEWSLRFQSSTKIPLGAIDTQSKDVWPSFSSLKKLNKIYQDLLW